MPLFVGHEVYRHCGYGSHHLLAIPRVAPVLDFCPQWINTVADKATAGTAHPEITALCTQAFARASNANCN